MNRLLRTFLVVIGLSVAGAAWTQPANAPVAISLSAGLEGNVLLIRGNATVPDGAWIIYAAYRVAEPQRRMTGYAQVRSERFSARVDIAGWPSGEIAVDAHFQTRLPAREQPEAIIARFGRNGERMRGDDVVQGGGGFRVAIASTNITKPR